MKNANGYGSISKLSGKRRRPWVVRITVSREFDEATMRYRQIQKALGYYATRSEAIKALADYNDRPFDLNKASVTFADVYEVAKNDFTDARRRNYEAAYKYLSPIQDMPIRNITTMQMQKCINECTTTQQTEIKTVCHKVFECALKMDVTDRDPSRHLKSITVAPKINRQLFTSEEIKQLESSNDWWCKILLMLLYSGMRTKELRTLSPNDIDIENRCINIRIAKNKSSIRKLPIHSHVLPLFCDYKAAGGNLYGFTHNGLNKAIKTNIETLHHAHDCRHTFTTRMHECGCDPLVLQKMLGHAPTSITERVYTHLSIEELRRYLERLQY